MKAQATARLLTITRVQAVYTYHGGDSYASQFDKLHDNNHETLVASTSAEGTENIKLTDA